MEVSVYVIDTLQVLMNALAVEKNGKILAENETKEE